MTTDLTDAEIALLGRLGAGRYVMVRGEDEKTAEKLHRRVPCLVAMGPSPNPIISITDAGKDAWAEIKDAGEEEGSGTAG